MNRRLLFPALPLLAAAGCAPTIDCNTPERAIESGLSQRSQVGQASRLP